MYYVAYGRLKNAFRDWTECLDHIRDALKLSVKKYAEGSPVALQLSSSYPGMRGAALLRKNSIRKTKWKPWSTRWWRRQAWCNSVYSCDGSSKLSLMWKDDVHYTKTAFSATALMFYVRSFATIKRLVCPRFLVRASTLTCRSVLLTACPLSTLVDWRMLLTTGELTPSPNSRKNLNARRLRSLMSSWDSPWVHSKRPSSNGLASCAIKSRANSYDKSRLDSF